MDFILYSSTLFRRQRYNFFPEKKQARERKIFGTAGRGRGEIFGCLGAKQRVLFDLIKIGFSHENHIRITYKSHTNHIQITYKTHTKHIDLSATPLHTEKNTIREIAEGGSKKVRRKLGGDGRAEMAGRISSGYREDRKGFGGRLELAMAGKEGVSGNFSGGLGGHQ